MSITINGYQIRHALDLLDGEDETPLEFEELPERKDTDTGETMPAGLYCWFAEYPDEGVVYLPDSADG